MSAAPIVSLRERCLVCGHYHGGQGSCITRHAFVDPEDCATCMREASATQAPVDLGTPEELPDAYVTVYPKGGPVTLGGAYSKREHADTSARINGNGCVVKRYVPICESSLAGVGQALESITRTCVLRDGHRGEHRAEDGSTWGRLPENG